MLAISFTPDAREQYIFWQSQDRKTLKRINILIEAATRDPFGGIGKPEPLTANLKGYFSRRINEKNRLVYRATATDIIVISCRYHYTQ